VKYHPYLYHWDFQYLMSHIESTLLTSLLETNNDVAAKEQNKTKLDSGFLRDLVTMVWPRQLEQTFCIRSTMESIMEK
ncbi:hypothetical protein PENTCL1PPCAC_23663, partial [Pristionchus entomophagus]